MRRLSQAVPALFAVVLTLAACGAQPAPAQPTPTVATVQPATAVANTAAAPAPTQTPTVAATAAPTDWLNTATLDGGYFVLGNPGAAVRLTDFSDFL